MKRRLKSSSTLNTIIDLTSLLDVIFILLFVVMISSKQRVIDANEKAEDLKNNLTKTEEKNSELEQELSDTKDELNKAEMVSSKYASDTRISDELSEKIDNLNDYVAFIVIDVYYSPTDPTSRTIKIMNGDSLLFNKKFSNDTAGSSWNQCEDALGAFVSDKNSENIPVIVSVTHDDILNRDMDTVSTMLSELQDSYDNLYEK